MAVDRRLLLLACSAVRWSPGWEIFFQGASFKRVRVFFLKGVSDEACSDPDGHWWYAGRTREDTLILHLEVIKRMMVGDIFVVGGSSQRGLGHSRWCNDFVTSLRSDVKLRWACMHRSC